MFAFLKKLQRGWDDWVGDREMEQAIRRHLSSHGYYGNSATLSRVRLAAVARPGWVQVFQFDVDAKVAVDVPDDEPDPEPVFDSLFGILRDDARGHHTEIRLFQTAAERAALFDTWSDGLLRMRGANR